ncbi:hypothetical protein JDV02_004139 [Purpureocillium takamizusanense]|uniref:Kinetochore protein mis14 n=1 Tax=Purpureocillium takamizusanense TaxID=2060973 RepID=A0A9Q8QF86_9HYPO|nr:uncharacterized protein JDV02_004139 [Purpureocillium takamizusanense]UNI17821.1 hypothetical protein JDV02_004139 [Purpureocillium takamizusanense]
MATDPVVAQVQRKIELQAPEDLAYLLANVRRAAADRIDEAFPPVEGADRGEDRLRNQIEALVNEYIDKTFSLAAPNLSINGLPVPNSLVSGGASAAQDHDDTAYEPFDTRKRQRIADRTAEEERLLEEVAALKRSVPAAAAAQQAARVREGLDRDEELLHHRIASSTAAAAAEHGPRIGVLPRQDAVEAAFGGAVDALGRLKRDMPAVVAKMERARVAGKYVVTDGR